ESAAPGLRVFVTCGWNPITPRGCAFKHEGSTFRRAQFPAGEQFLAAGDLVVASANSRRFMIMEEMWTWKTFREYLVLNQIIYRRSRQWLHRCRARFASPGYRVAGTSWSGPFR